MAEAKAEAANVAEWIDLLVANATRLREAGVLRFRVGELEAHLAPPPAELPKGFAPAEDEPIHDALYDSWTFGRPGGRIPGFEEVMRQRSERMRGDDDV